MENRVLVSCLSSSWGGLEMVSAELTAEFQQHGFDARLVCCEDTTLEKTARQMGLTVETIPQKSSLKKTMQLRKLINSFRPNKIVINRLPSLKFMVPALIGRSSIDLFCISHMLVDYNKKDFYHGLLYKRIKTMIVLTEYQKENHLKYLPIPLNKMKIVPDWIPGETEASSGPIDLKSFFDQSVRHLSVGVIASRLDPQKGQELAIEALNMAVKRNRPFLLVVMGDNTFSEKDMKSHLQQIVKVHGLEKYVCFMGFKKNIFPYLRGADFTLVPSREETFGRIIIESMGVGTPVIGSRSGSIPCIITDNKDGLMHNPNDADDLESKVNMVCSNQEFKSQVSLAGKTTSELYNKDKIFAQIQKTVFPE